MIPLRDHNRLTTIPFVTVLLILANVLVFAYEVRLGPNAASSLIEAFGTIPYEVAHNVDLDSPIRVPVFVTLLTSTFLHGGFVHIFFNMLYLLIFGNDIEERFGHVRFLLVYLVWGVFASLVQVMGDINQKIPTIGASGAIAGVLGAYIMILPTAKIDSLLLVVPVRIPSLILIGQWIVFQFVEGRFFELHPRADDGIAYYAHIGGVAAGLMTGLIYRALRPTEFENEWATW